MLKTTLIGLVLSMSGFAAAADTWDFNPPKDTFEKSAYLDMREFNETIAGENGFVRLSSDGESFVDGKGKAIRFWSLNTGAYNQHPKLPKIDFDRHARFIAKRGVNMVRFHGNITPKNGDIHSVDQTERDKLWRTVATMKKVGIYTTYSPYWANSSHLKPGQQGIVSAKSNAGLLFIDETLQAAYKNWFKQVLTEKNTYTGIALKDDPALAVIQIQNEDSLLFWTAQGIDGQAKIKLQELFGAFAVKKYGSIDKAIDAWSGTKLNGDKAEQGQLELYIVWEMTKGGNITKGGSEGQKLRISDQLECLTKIMYDFNAEIKRYLVKDLGCKQLVNAGNWKTADNVTLNDAERWSYTANDIIGANRYYSPVHTGEHRGWAIVNGDQFADDSVLKDPRSFPLTMRLVTGHPMCIYESSWVPPLGYQSEGPLLVAAYSSLTGFDSYYWFAMGQEDWRQPQSANGYMPSIGKWNCDTPMLMGQWPAASLAFRMGYIKEGSTVVDEHRALDDIWQRRQSIIVEDSGYDPNRDKGNIVEKSNVKAAVDQMAFLVGPVKVTYDSDPQKSKVDPNLEKSIDLKSKKVLSNTGELAWDYAKGIVTVNAPKVQGVSGFIQGETIKLTDLEFETTNEYMSIIAISLDDKELSKSTKILIQVGTKERPADWRESAVKIEGGVNGKKIESFGKAPWQIDVAKLSISVANSKLKTAIICDENFMPRGKVDLVKKGKLLSFDYPADAMYVVLSADK